MHARVRTPCAADNALGPPSQCHLSLSRGPGTRRRRLLTSVGKCISIDRRSKGAIGDPIMPGPASGDAQSCFRPGDCRPRAPRSRRRWGGRGVRTVLSPRCARRAAAAAAGCGACGTDSANAGSAYRRPCREAAGVARGNLAIGRRRAPARRTTRTSTCGQVRCVVMASGRRLWHNALLMPCHARMAAERWAMASRHYCRSASWPGARR